MNIDRSQYYRSFLLHRRSYSNSSLLIECFTAEFGRFPVIAKGVRSGKSRDAGQLQPFQPLLLKMTGKGEIKTLTGCEPIKTDFRLQGEALYCGFYLNELLMGLLGRSDPHAELFEFYLSTLEELAVSHNQEPVLRYFEVRLLQELGYGLLLDRETEGERPIEPGKRYHYLLEQGPVTADQGDVSALRGETLLALGGRQEYSDRESMREARALMRRVISHYLGGRNIKSRELFGRINGGNKK